MTETLESFASEIPLPQFELWNRTEKNRIPITFTLEITARCNLNCRHCYINLPAGDAQTKRRELTFSEIDSLTSQAVELGALWCLVTGGEPLLRSDFAEIYRLLKRKGLLVSVFTNACLVTEEHVRLFQEYPPRDLEVTVYGITRETFGRVTRRPAAYSAFRSGLERLLKGGIKVRLKTMALRSNFAELKAIAEFCRAKTCDAFRYDPLLHLRLDGNPQRNAEILSERLSALEIASLEQADAERLAALKKTCASGQSSSRQGRPNPRLLQCGAGVNSFTIGYDGMFRLCEALVHPSLTYNLREGSLTDAWGRFAPAIRNLPSEANCWNCPLNSLCLWCPAHALLEFGQAESYHEYYCQVAQARAANLNQSHHTADQPAPQASELL